MKLFDARIQNVEISVPTATISVAKKCAPTRCQPNSITPRKPASRKNAVSTSYVRAGP